MRTLSSKGGVTGGYEIFDEAQFQYSEVGYLLIHSFHISNGIGKSNTSMYKYFRLFLK